MKDAMTNSERGLHRVIQFSSAFSLGLMAAFLYSVKQVTPELRCELSAVGYREIATHKLAGDGGYLAVFSPPDNAGRKSPRDIVACGDRAGTR